MRRRVFPLVVMLVVALTGGLASATSTPEALCQKGRYKAAAKYVDCHQRTFAGFFGGRLVDPISLRLALAKCRDKYQGTWAKLEAAATGTGATCDVARFTAGGDGTVVDHLTGLQWEQKTADASLHDESNRYTWSNAMDAAPGSGDGSAYTVFLATLNGGCFAGQCDWRLPTIAELLSAAEPHCSSAPCFDPIFGVTTDANYWSSTSVAGTLGQGWELDMFFNTTEADRVSEWTSDAVLAVRGGL